MKFVIAILLKNKPPMYFDSYINTVMGTTDQYVDKSACKRFDTYEEAAKKARALKWPEWAIQEVPH
jgi:hypothetical protein